MQFLRNRLQKGFTLIELLVVISIIALLSAIVLASLASTHTNSRDTERVSEIRQIQYALNEYYSDKGNFPTCLYPGGSCKTTLQGTPYMPDVPHDPLTNLGYTYAATGVSTVCSGYHLGASFEQKSNVALQSGADAPAKAVCTGSAADFSGLSYAAGGQLCTKTAGVAQPTTSTKGETCYDVAN